jgi:exportin-2 (importin alpha re-exporter)
LELHRALLTSRTPTFLALLDLFTLPQDITYSAGNGAADDLLELDPEEAGFQSSFSKLGASEKSVHDPVAHVGDAKVYASREISTRSKERPGVVSLPAKACGHALMIRSNP